MKATAIKLSGFLLVLLLCLCRGGYAQSKAGQRAELMGYNLGFGIVSTAVGSLINKPKRAPAWPYIRKSLWQGAVGGVLQYSGKALTYQITRTQNCWWGWGSKLVHSAGASICLNASMNYRFGQYWVLDYGPARLNFTFDRGSLSFQPQFNLLFLNDLGVFTNMGGRMDWKRTIQSGSFIFSTSYDHLYEVGGNGSALSHSAILVRPSRYSVVAHELVHLYQSNEYRVINSYWNPLIFKINGKVGKALFKWVNIELPYNLLPYQLSKNSRYYYRNFYEFEAAFFSTNSYVNKNEILNW